MDKPVSFEMAKLLEEKRFDKKTLFIYNKIGELSNIHFSVLYSAPTIAEVVMWLYEKHGIWVYVDSHEFGKWCYSTKFNRPHELYPRITENGKFGLEDYNSPTEAYEAAIKHVLKEFKTLI